ncbi:MAG: cytochrome c maturation protein CcmE [Firmicutes bacterium]|nr:cytochrome c maturation protein CcmE [Bacillota bacterium]
MVDSKSKTRLMVVTVVLVAIIGYMVYSLLSNSSSSSLSYYKKVEEVIKDDSYVGKTVKVGGEIKKGTVVQKGNKYTFKIFEKDKELTVTYSGQVPSTFGAGVQAIVEGKLVSQNMLEAKSITTKCPSKYKSKKIGGE